MSQRIALVAGPTGLVGKILVQRLLRDPAYARVVAVSRRPLAHDEGRLHTLITDYSDLDRRSAELRADDVFCCLGTTLRQAGSRAAFEKVDHDMVVALAQATRAAGAKRFLVVSAVGSSERSAAFYSRVKGRMEAAVAEMGFAAVHIVRPSLLLGERAESRPGERLGQLAAPLLAPLLRGPLAKYRPVTADEVAAALLTLAHGDAVGVHVHHLPL